MTNNDFDTPLKPLFHKQREELNHFASEHYVGKKWENYTFRTKCITISYLYTIIQFFNLISVSFLFFSDGIRQFVVVTGIDKIGVPIEDMKHAYKYGFVRKHCEKVSEVFDVDLYHILPVSNYCGEATSNNAKNAMSLFNFWRVFNSGKCFIERHWNKKETPAGSRKVIYQRK